LGSCLYIKAGTGLGKSHLTHAVAHHILNNAPGTRLHYLTAQQLTGEMVKAIQSNTMALFKEKYQNNCDILLIDDIHAIDGKPKTQIELAEIVDFLLDRRKRIIFTSSKAPQEINNIDSSFRSRLTSGLITTINPPDLLTRILIIQRKSRNYQLSLNEELVTFLAEQVKGDIRQVQSVIVGLKAYCGLLKTEPDLLLVKETLKNIIGRQSELTAEANRNFIAGQFKVTINDLCSKSRKKAVAFPRQISMYLARKYTKQPLADIGRAFNRDHSTVVHSVRVITEQIARNGSVRGQIELISDKLQKKYM
jgi:chromosomal replication initiator protein